MIYTQSHINKLWSLSEARHKSSRFAMERLKYNNELFDTIDELEESLGDDNEN